jgi:hypothetical protein
MHSLTLDARNATSATRNSGSLSIQHPKTESDAKTGKGFPDIGSLSKRKMSIARRQLGR